MKKIFSLVITIAMLFSLVASFGVVSAETTSSSFVEGIDPYPYLSEITSTFPDRTAGTPAGKLFADDISNKLKGFGYTSGVENADGFQEFAFENHFKQNEVQKGYNVIFKKDNTEVANEVVIGASFDNASGLPIEGGLLGGQGAYGNGVGLAVFMSLADYYKDKTLPFDLTFVAFDAGVPGNFGSQYFYESLGIERVDNMLLMVNLNSVAGGDKIYIYTDEVKTKHSDFFYNTAGERNLGFSAVPDYKRQSVLFANDVAKTPYLHHGLSGDNAIFMSGGINTVSFMSLNWEDKSTPQIVEVAGKENLLYTNIDTLEMLEQRLGEGGREKLVSQLKAVSTAVIATLEKDDFTAVMVDSRQSKFDYSFLSSTWYTTLTFAVKLIIVVLAIVMSNLLVKRYRLENPFTPIIISQAPVIDPFEEIKSEKPNGKDDIFDGF